MKQLVVLIDFFTGTRKMGSFQAEFQKLLAGNQRIKVRRIGQVTYPAMFFHDDVALIMFQARKTPEQCAFAGTVLSYDAIRFTFL